MGAIQGLIMGLFAGMHRKHKQTKIQQEVTDPNITRDELMDLASSEKGRDISLEEVFLFGAEYQNSAKDVLRIWNLFNTLPKKHPDVTEFITNAAATEESKGMMDKISLFKMKNDITMMLQ